MEAYIIDFLAELGVQYEKLSEFNIIHIYNLYKNDIFDGNEECDSVFYCYAARYYWYKEDYKRAIELYQIAIDKGDGDAINELAEMHLSEHVLVQIHEHDNDHEKWIQRDYERAIELYKMGIDKGNEHSMNGLAIMYTNGTGVETDYKRAIELYQMAIDQGNEYSMHNVAIRYANGEGVEKDYKRAIELYQMAIKKGVVNSMNNLAVMYLKGEGVETDHKQQAIELYQMAINKGCARAINNLAVAYEQGTGVETDYKRSIELFELAVEKGDTAAINNLARIYKNGMGVPKDYDRAVQLYQKGIDNGKGSCMRKLAKMYMYGKGVQKDNDRAIQLYKMAIKKKPDNKSVKFLISLSNKRREYYKKIRKIFYKHYKRTNDIAPLKAMKDTKLYIVKKKNKELENKIRELDSKVEMLMCAPPPQGGPIYQSSCEHFAIAKKERDNLYIDNNYINQYQYIIRCSIHCFHVQVRLGS